MLGDIKTSIEILKALGSFAKKGKDIICAKWLNTQGRIYEDSFKEMLGIGLDNNSFSVFSNTSHMYFEKEASLPNTLYVQKLLVSASLKKAKKHINFETRLFDVPIDTDAYIVGSPTSEIMAQYMFGYELEPNIDPARGNYQVFTGLIDFPVRWVLNRENTQPGGSTHYLQRDNNTNKLTFRLIDEDEPKLPNWGIELDASTISLIKKDIVGEPPSRLFPADDSYFVIDGESRKLLSRDYLLITRMPNVFSKNAVDRNRFIVSVAGTHGMGTLAFEELLRNKKIRTEIAKALYETKIDTSIKARAKIGFQMLFEVDLNYTRNRVAIERIRPYANMKPISFGNTTDWESVANSIAKKLTESKN